MTAYIDKLNLECKIEPLPGSAVEADLRERLIAWIGRIPDVSRQRPFAMAELEQALNTQGKYLGPILLSLGWKRKRKWGSGQYSRFWLPP